MEAAIKEAAEVSMGTEVADMDIVNIQSLAEQVLSLTEYRSQLYEYLKNRMNAIAPNLTILGGRIGRCSLDCSCGFPHEFGKVSCLDGSNFGCRKGTLSCSQNQARYSKVWSHLSCLSCRTSFCQE